MGRFIRGLLPIALAAGGAYFFRESYDAYGAWRAYAALGDPSGAEFYEMNFMLYTPPAFAFLCLACFLAGRWLSRKR